MFFINVGRNKTFTLRDVVNINNANDNVMLTSITRIGVSIKNDLSTRLTKVAVISVTLNMKLEAKAACLFYIY